MILSFDEYLFEQNQRYYIYTRRFRFDDLRNVNIYTPQQLLDWQTKYKIYDLDLCIFISLNEIKQQQELTRKSSRDIKNKYTFSPESQKMKGYIIDESEHVYGNDIIYLYVFQSRRNTRQIHGFNYEIVLRELNNLKNAPKYSDRWDAFGSLKQKFFIERIKSGKNIQIFDGKNYHNYVSFNDKLLDVYKMKKNHWNIKSPDEKGEIDMGSYTRISNYNREYKPIIQKIDHFIFAIGFHDNQKNIKKEYIIAMNMKIWESYLPDMSNIDKFKEMKKELLLHRLGSKWGERTSEKEANWKEFIYKYKDLCKDSVVKLRFKRDSKGQLRIQSAISNSDFKNKILKNPHILIN